MLHVSNDQKCPYVLFGSEVKKRGGWLSPQALRPSQSRLAQRAQPEKKGAPVDLRHVRPPHAPGQPPWPSLPFPGPGHLSLTSSPGGGMALSTSAHPHLCLLPSQRLAAKDPNIQQSHLQPRQGGLRPFSLPRMRTIPLQYPFAEKEVGQGGMAAGLPYLEDRKP